MITKHNNANKILQLINYNLYTVKNVVKYDQYFNF